jgi:hypothetical protein
LDQDAVERPGDLLRARAPEASPEGPREKGRFTPKDQPQKKQAGQMKESAFGYPVIANGRLYIRDLESLWAFDIQARP